MAVSELDLPLPPYEEIFPQGKEGIPLKKNKKAIEIFELMDQLDERDTQTEGIELCPYQLSLDSNVH